MAGAKHFISGYNQDLIVNDWFNLAASEIYETYGDKVKINRKTLQKFGKGLDINSTETSINFFSRDEVFATGNTIDTISSSDAADTQTMRIEGMVLDSNNDMLESEQEVTLNGQNKVTLTTPLYRVNRIRNSSATPTAGDVHVYEDTAIVGGIPTDLDFWHGTFSQEFQTSVKAATSIASNTYFLLARWDAFINRQSGAAVDFRLRWGTHGNHLPVKEFMSARNTSPHSFLDFRPFRPIPPNNDIVAKAVATSNNTEVNSDFLGIYADIVN